MSLVYADQWRRRKAYTSADSNISKQNVVHMRYIIRLHIKRAVCCHFGRLTKVMLAWVQSSI